MATTSNTTLKDFIETDLMKRDWPADVKEAFKPVCSKLLAQLKIAHDKTENSLFQHTKITPFCATHNSGEMYINIEGAIELLVSFIAYKK
mmetsp:Transcript_76168/g.105797  ORF Transcript_76168/g.105797 Transcript_76168/m.105797 type:complete len:90 (+) Transcript_76168:75-344(+)